MISAEAPVLFAKAAQIFITELTLRAWIHTEDNKRRTLQVRHTHRDAFSSSFLHSFTSSLYDTCFTLIRSRFSWGNQLTCLSTATFCPICWDCHILIITFPLSSFCKFLPSFSFFNSSPTPLHHLIVFLVCYFLFLECLCLCAYTSRGPIPASPWGRSLCLVLSPSIDFESKARRVPLTHFSLRCHFACSAVPKLNKMDSGMIWGGKKGKRRTWERWWEQLGKSD